MSSSTGGVSWPFSLSCFSKSAISSLPYGHTLACTLYWLFFLFSCLLSCCWAYCCYFWRFPFPPLFFPPPLAAGSSCWASFSSSLVRSFSGRRPRLTHTIASYSDRLTKRSKHLLRKFTEQTWLSSAIRRHSLSSILISSCVCSLRLKQSGSSSSRFK